MTWSSFRLSINKLFCNPPTFACKFINGTIILEAAIQTPQASGMIEEG
jgi:hypothetical protein